MSNEQKSVDTLVLLPGLGDDEALWRHQSETLGSVCVPRVLVLDRQETIAEMAATVLEQVDGRFALAGFSMGVRVSLEIVHRAAERVTRLALVSGSARPGRETIAAPYEGTLEEIIETQFVQSMHEAARSRDAVTDEVRRMVRRRGLGGLTRQQRAIMSSPGHLDLLARIRCPTLVVCGREDPVTPSARSEEMASAIPGARLVVLERCGHYVPLERPRETSAALGEWLGSV